MRNYFLQQREMRLEILGYLEDDSSGGSEDDIVHHVLTKLGIYQTSITYHPFLSVEVGSRLRAMLKKMAEDNLIRKFVFHLDGEDINWYLDYEADLPDWMFALEEGTDWTV